MNRNSKKILLTAIIISSFIFGVQTNTAFAVYSCGTYGAGSYNTAEGCTTNSQASPTTPDSTSPDTTEPDKTDETTPPDSDSEDKDVVKQDATTTTTKASQTTDYVMWSLIGFGIVTLIGLLLLAFKKKKDKDDA